MARRGQGGEEGKGKERNGDQPLLYDRGGPETEHHEGPDQNQTRHVHRARHKTAKVSWNEE